MGVVFVLKLVTPFLFPLNFDGLGESVLPKCYENVKKSLKGLFDRKLQ